jgi:hypothetical protein
LDRIFSKMVLKFNTSARNCFILCHKYGIFACSSSLSSAQTFFNFFLTHYKFISEKQIISGWKLL